jgi:Tfp pilus assembly protein PilN
MTQRIDLYRDDLRPRQPSGEFRRNLLLVGLVLAVLLAWGAVMQWRDHTSGTELARLTDEQAAIQAEMATASARLAERKPDPAITAALVDAQFAVDGRRWLAEQLAQAGDEVVPFSEVLAGLGRQRPEPLWLTRIHVAGAGASLGLSGRTLDAGAVPGYLEDLAAESALKGREFSHFRIDRSEKAAEPLSFDMATDCVALAGGCDDLPAGENQR